MCVHAYVRACMRVCVSKCNKFAPESYSECVYALLLISTMTCDGMKSYQEVIIGASLSEPYINGTAIRAIYGIWYVRHPCAAS